MLGVIGIAVAQTIVGQAVPVLPPQDLLTYVLGLGAAGGPLFFGLWVREQFRHDATRKELSTALSSERKELSDALNASQEKRIDQGLAMGKVIEGLIAQITLLQSAVNSMAGLVQQVLYKQNGGK